MSHGFLDTLESLLAAGLSGLDPRFIQLQVEFVARSKGKDGGFGGPVGGSDAYYSDFGLRILSLLSPGHPAWANCRGFVQGLADSVAQNPTMRDRLLVSAVECFGLLNASRLLARQGWAVNLPVPVITDRLDVLSLPGGGFARLPGGRLSGTQTFLAALCYEMLEQPMPDLDRHMAALATLRRDDGGYSEMPGQKTGQTNATAAVMTLLMGTLDDAALAALAEFLVAAQAPDGALRAHPDMDQGDLLSTFSGLLALTQLDVMQRIDLPRLARFLKASAHPAGGFAAGPGVGDPDIEYTYYGLGSLAQLRSYAKRQIENIPRG